MKIRAVRVELLKPIDRSWDEIGTILRDQRSITHRLLNAVILRCILALRTKEDGAIETLAYQEVGIELDRIRQWALAQAEKPTKKRKTKKKKKDPEAAVDELKAEKDRIRGRERLLRQSVIDLPGGTKSGISNLGFDQYNKWLKAGGDEKMPGFRRGAPIPIRAQEWSALEDEEGRPLLKLKLEAGTKTGQVRFAIRASKGRHWQQIRQLTKGEIKHGDCKILYDERKKKWYALLAFKEEDAAPLTADPSRALIVHRGVRNFLVAMSTTGHFAVVARGNKLYAQKRALGRRMKDTKMISIAERGSGAKGHGRRRRYENYDALQNKLSRIIKTTCQQVAARVLQLAKQWGCGLIVIEEYGGIDPDEDRALRRFIERFPLAQLKGSIAWVCKRDGYSLVEVPAQYVSTTCPRCHAQDERSHNRTTGVFHCKECGLERDADFVAAINMLRNANVDSSLWDKRFEQERKLAVAAK